MVESVGVKDIILPDKIKAILAKVVEAEKAARANVIRRRKETAATRSMLNTAKVMEDNPVALRLKELEVLEHISEKIEKINVGLLALHYGYGQANHPGYCHKGLSGVRTRQSRSARVRGRAGICDGGWEQPP